MINTILIALLAWPIVGQVLTYGYICASLAHMYFSNGVNVDDAVNAGIRIIKRDFTVRKKSTSKVKAYARDWLWYMEWPKTLSEAKHVMVEIRKELLHQ